MTIGKNMLVVTSTFRGAKSFNLIPATPECPYVEAMFDPIVIENFFKYN